MAIYKPLPALRTVANADSFSIVNHLHADDHLLKYERSLEAVAPLQVDEGKNEFRYTCCPSIEMGTFSDCPLDIEQAQ